MKQGLFVGLCGLDVIFYEKNKFPEEDTKMKCSDVGCAIGGPAANAAITYTMLGGQATIVSYVGNSNVGLLIKSMLAKLNIKLIDLCLDDDIKCVSSIYINTDNATRTIFSGRNEIHKLDSFKLLEDAIKESDFILYDGHFSHIDDVLLETAKKENKKIVIDVGGWKDTFKKILSYNPILICSEVFENEGLNGIEMRKIYGVDQIAITKGKKTFEYQDFEKHGFIEPLKVDSVDTLGAGDIFHGAFCYYMFEKEQCFVDALESAKVVAGISTTKYGVIPGVQGYLDSI